ncbi:uncharacterized protein LOC143293668 isoform X2 [Babylonia areolata]
MGSGHGNVSVGHGGGTETLETLSSTAAMVYDRHVSNYPQETLVTLCVLLGCMIVATVLGNVFVITAILVERSLHGVSNYLILSLAVTDLLVAVLVMPLSLLNEVSVYWYLGRALCDMWVSMDVLCCTASILHLVAIAMDRFWAVSKIDYVRRRCARQILVMIAVVWLVSVAISIPPLFGWRHESDNPELSGVCMISQDHGYTIFSTVGAFYCPLVLMLVLNYKIYKAARYRIRRKGFAHAGRKSRRTGHLAVPVVQVEQDTAGRDGLRNSSGSDVSQDGLSMFNPSCLANNEISRIQMDLDSNTGDYDQNYSSYGGESSDSRQNDSYYPLATEDPDFSPNSSCFLMGPLSPSARAAEMDTLCAENGAHCAQQQLDSLNPAPPAPATDRGCTETGDNCGHHQRDLMDTVTPAGDTDTERMCADHGCQLDQNGHVSLTVDTETDRPCMEAAATISCAHHPLMAMGHTSPAADTDTDTDKPCTDTSASCSYQQLNPVSLSSPVAETDENGSCTECGHHQLMWMDQMSPPPTETDADNACSECGNHQLMWMDHISLPTETEADKACSECSHHQMTWMDHISPSTETEENKVCTECGNHQLMWMDHISPATETADKACSECSHHQMMRMDHVSPATEADQTCSKCSHQRLISVDQAAQVPDTEPDRWCTQTGADCAHHQLNSMGPSSPVTETDTHTACADTGSQCDHHPLNPAFRSLSISHLTEGEICLSTEPIFHYHSASEVINCVSCDTTDGLSSQEWYHSAVVKSQSAPVQMSVGKCDFPLVESSQDQPDHMVKTDTGVEISDPSKSPRSEEGEALLTDNLNVELNRKDDTNPTANGNCSNNLLSVELNCVSNGHNHHHHNHHNHHQQQQHIQANHVTAECTALDTPRLGCNQIHPSTNCLNLPNTHNNPSIAITSAAVATTSVSAGTANQLKVPPLRSTHTRQTNKPHANNNTKRARNREKEKQRREKLEMRRERKAARVLGIITGAFVLCWLPFFILALVLPFLPLSCHVPPVLTSLFLWLGYFNSLLNPIIYTIFNPSFRKAFRKIFFKRLSSLTRS